MDNSPSQVFVVSHTHWDREWYLTFNEFRVDLTRVVAGVLTALESDPEFEHFVMDGQAIALEDHLAVQPEDESRISALCRAGKLSLGPWYILPDEFLVSGEAMARNLLIGHQVCARFGGAQKVGYMPDSFGHLAQIPQLLQQAGIDSFIYTRGNGDEIEELGHEYIWEAPDGSEVLAINQCGGYCNGGGLGFQEIWHAHTSREVDCARAVEQIGELFDKMTALSRSSIRLLNNGCDHFPVQQEFGRVLGALREAYPTVEFHHGSFVDFLSALRATDFKGKRFRGELLGGKQHHILSGVWSARMPLKQANDECQHLLARVLEPSCAALHFLHDQDYPAGLIVDAWKRLLANHPHDSICGCSTDEVHREMMPRFAGVRETAERILSRGLNDIAPRFGAKAEEDRDTAITVFNPLPVKREEIVERVVILQPPQQDLDRLGLFDESGAPVPFRIVEQQFVERFWGVDYRAELFTERQRERFAVYTEKFAGRILRPDSEADSADCFLRVQFEARNLPALGHANFFLRGTDTPPASSSNDAVELTGNTIGNGLLRVTLHADGSIDLEDLRSGRRFPGLNRLVDDEDAGDEYDHSHSDLPTTLSVMGSPGQVRCLESSPFRVVLESDCDFRLPTSLTEDRRARQEELRPCRLRVRITLDAGSPLLDIDLHFDNQVLDHRLRAEFPTGLATEQLVSDGHFLIHERPLTPSTGEDWVQPHPGTYPQQDYSLLQDHDGGLALLVKGLPEVMPLRNAEGAGISLTLLRSVGWLSRDDFSSRRRSNAGPTLPTPEAQCMGAQRFRYALLPFAGDHLQAGVKGWSERWRTRPHASQGVATGLLAGGNGLLENLSPRCAVTAIKHCEGRDSLLLRIVNLDGMEQEAWLRVGRPVHSVWSCDLLEDRQEKLENVLQGNEIRITLPGHRILTLELDLK
ncbi:MAG: hypothetical protein GY946_29060 [bacterium]|nr:hypothetical protein [bacterium]